MFLRKLLRFYLARRNQTRGFHLCPFCPNPDFGVPLEVDGKTIKLGSAEIHVEDDHGGVFVAPDLLYHYIVVHHYRPPRGFIETVCLSNRPPTPQHLAPDT